MRQTGGGSAESSEAGILSVKEGSKKWHTNLGLLLFHRV
jgi:hypothetical protein